jgi:hypothetical protein
MVVKTDAITFPASAKGIGALEDILVRRFGFDFENVYTFCLSEPPEATCKHFACHLLVGMSAKANGQIRVGCGRYDWHFGAQGRVEKLVVTVEVMKVLSAEALAAGMSWLSALPYPWCSADEACKRMPALDGLGEIRAYLKEVGPISVAP